MIDIILGIVGQSPLEWTGVAGTLLFLHLLGKRQPMGWPAGIVACICYAEVFRRAELYADMGLQIVFILQLAYGWMLWLRSPGGTESLVVSRTSRREATWLISLWLIATPLLGAALFRITGQGVSFADAGLAIASMLAQWMQAKRRLENWGVWILINLGFIVVYWMKDLRLTAVLALVLIVLALRGHRLWSRSLQGSLQAA